ncbi:thiamine-phosphate diphosphorylase [Rhizobium sp. RU20A]|uniref:thiamine phosphate synthase n=1 Tax=Rhizobium sp. RU20A TaxID=1907412 RepID=UPI00095531B1|nr:thiamine phosphate synthase [Rhizobium sp. RU20A]SIQ34120.1 thiamine-phosphate diphosphorylase [Rhizobium sp. RU20A]
MTGHDHAGAYRDARFGNRRVDYRLNPILDAGLVEAEGEAGGARLAALAARAVSGGATILQYRDKTGSTRRMVDNARAILWAIAASGVPLVVNDRVDVALAAGAHGVHLGADDMEIETARRLLGPSAIIGMTVKREAEARAAGQLPVDYACIGGVFETLSKHNPDPPVGLDGFRQMRAMIRAARPELPVGAIAGITAARVPPLVLAGADGIAAISAVFGAADVAGAARALRGAVDDALKGEAA